ncbi:MAG: hypothetical protein ABS939_15360 [Psychrobacillus sp.]
MTKLTKILLTVLVVSSISLGSMVFYLGSELAELTSNDPNVENGSGTNVGDGKTYIYKVIEVEGEEVHGLPMNRISQGNRGIFLYKSEIKQDVKVGDTVAVVWGEEEDEFKSIKVYQ